ncbi:diguanylate cyclase/phosphodiesterase (GGDEF & EAL domains) with PAS/PAC sensor(s) [hydrothermal vent metagenome]|uniref:Diguanylate cyclase/phosphodiesterase (GGDEF & EAL domains) with PAS/PAC sensor(S) n=1 Tax=hydrothermal vent metagenome TaxID=652676 RepID=A0A3B0W7S1_9ZZZZ
MSNLYKLLLILITIIGFITYDSIYTVPIENVRLYNILVEFSFSLMCAVLFMSISSLKGKSFYNFLCIGFYLVFVSMLVDGLDQFHVHGELYTAIFEKTTLLIGVILVFFGMKAWIVDHGLMNKKLEKMAFTDELTGLFNRRGMLKKFEAMDELSKTNQLTLSFIIADLDDFKVFNDTMGHVSGDAYLADLGQSLLAMANKTTVIGRWGGEEFAVCMLGTDLNQAFEFSEKIRQTVVQIPMPPEMKKQNMTVSLGVSQKMPQEKFMDAIKRADRSLYSAKNQGKNQSVAD